LYHRRYYQHNARITTNRHTQQLRHAPHIRNNVPVFFLFLLCAQIRARARKPSSSALFAKERRRRESTFYIDAGAWVLGRTKEEERFFDDAQKCIRACVDFFSSSSSKYLAYY